MLEVMSPELRSWIHMRYHWVSVYGAARAVPPHVLSSYSGLYTPAVVLTSVRAKRKELVSQCGKFLNDAYDTYELNFSSFGWSAQSAPYTFTQVPRRHPVIILVLLFGLITRHMLIFTLFCIVVVSTPLTRVDVYVTNQLVNGDDQYCGSINASTAVSHHIGYTVCNTPLDGRYLKIRNSDGSGIRICELEIFGKQHLFGRYIISYIAFYFKRMQCFIYRHELESGDCGGLRKDL